MSAPRGVLHLITTLDRGGAENALLHLCRALAGDSPMRAEVAFLKGRGELAAAFEAAGVPVHDLGLRGLRGTGAYARARQLVRHMRPVVLHTHLFKADCLGAAIARRPGTDGPVLVSTKHNQDMYLHGPSPRAGAWRAVAKRVAARADAVVAISTGVEQFVRETLGPSAKRIVTIPYGVPAPAEVSGTSSRERWGVPPEAPLLLCPARFDEQKDHATLLRAFGRLAGRSPAPWLVLLGRGPLETALREQAAALPHVVFGGFLEDPGPAYAAADIVVLPSRWEGLGLVLVEAALHGVPAVATSVGGIVDVIEDGVTGHLVPPGDDPALAAAAASLLDDPSLARRMGAAARERALREHDVATYVRRTAALYDDLLERSA